MSNETVSTPIELDFKSARSSSTDPVSVRTFSSYSFERSILTPASAFRFTAPGVSAALRQSIRSGDIVTLYVKGPSGITEALGTGIIDETDTHVTPKSVEYVLSGRDLIGQLVDNAVVDSQNRIINTSQITIDKILVQLVANTRIPQEFITQQIPNGTLLFQTRAGETKINALQRYLEFTNCLIWASPDGRVILGKPNFVQQKMGSLVLSHSDPANNNLLEARVRRNLNQAIRQIVTQLQTQDQVDAGSFTVNNNDADVKAVAPARVGKSIYNVFSYGQGSDAVNQIVQVGQGQGAPRVLGQALSLREIARENVKVLDVEVVMRGHINTAGLAYNIDQIYGVQLEADAVAEDMYVYSCSYELTLDHGMLTRMRLCRLGAICGDAAITGAS